MNHNIISLSKKAGKVMLAAAMAAAPAVNVFAAPEDIIDTSKTGSITLHKYDITAAAEDGVMSLTDLNDEDGAKYRANGKQNEKAESDLADYAIEGVVFTYAKVGDITTVSEGGEIVVKYGLPDTLAKILGLEVASDQLYTSDDITIALKNILTSKNTQSKNQLENYVKTDNDKVTMQRTDSRGVSQANNLPVGLYLFVETEVPANVFSTVDPFFVSLPMTTLEGEEWFYDIHVYPKNQTNIPDIDKLVRQHDDAETNANGNVNDTAYYDTATVSTGDTADYIIVSRLPKIDSTATYLTRWDYVDTASVGLVYNQDTVIYFYDNEADARANNTEKAVTKWTKDDTKKKFTTYYTAYSATYGTAGSATIKLTQAGLNEINMGSTGGLTDTLDNNGTVSAGDTTGVAVSQYKNYGQLYIVISYSMTIEKNEIPVLGDSGNTNDVVLTWERTGTPEDDLEDRCRVYIYGINLTKVFANSTSGKKADPTKVKFSLQNLTDGHFITARQKSSTSGVYFVTDDSKASTEEEGTVFSPNADGQLIIRGLEADKYQIVELETDDGYNLLKEPIVVEITATKDAFLPSLTTLYDTKDVAANEEAGRDTLTEVTSEHKDAFAQVDGSSTNMSADDTSLNAFVDMKITNTPGFNLPATGGAGTIAFTVAGCTVAFAGIAVMTKKSKKAKKA